MPRYSNWYIPVGFPTKTPSKQFSCLTCLILLDLDSIFSAVLKIVGLLTMRLPKPKDFPMMFKLANTAADNDHDL